MTLSEDWNNAQKDRKIRKAAVATLVKKARETLCVLGRWERLKLRLRLRLVLAEHSARYFFGIVHLLYQHFMCMGTEARFILWSVLFRRQRFLEARAELAQRRSWFPTQFRWDKAKEIAEDAA